MSPKAKPSRARPLPQISEAEWVVMRVLWARGPQTTNEVVATLADRSHWKPKTVHTLLSRLVKKGALAFSKAGREYRFEPLVTAQDCEGEAARSFLDRFFDGDLAPFLVRFMERQRLKPSEVERLKRILEGENL